MTRLFATAALFAIGILTAAHAAEPAPNQVVVAYGDLDLGTMAGQSQLKARLQDAAATVCSPLLTPPDSEPTVKEHMVVYRACIGRHIDRAMIQIQTRHN